LALSYQANKQSPELLHHPQEYFLLNPEVKYNWKLGRRKYIFHYSGGELGAVRYNDFKIHIVEGHGGLPGMEFYNIRRDPGEKYGKLYPGLFAVSPSQMFIGDHMKLIKKYPHRKPEK